MDIGDDALCYHVLGRGFLMGNRLVLLVFLVSSLGGLLDGLALAGQGCLNGDCHLALTRVRYLHGPVAAEMAGAKGCEICHQPTGEKCTPPRGGSFRTRKDICTTCHDKGTGSQHSQAEVESRCLSCHNPHGSETSLQMLRAKGDTKRQ